MKIIILGSTGYLGTKLVKSLCDKHDLICLKLAEDKAKSLDDIKDKIRIENIEEFLNRSNKCDCLINLACRYQRSGISDYEVFDSNLISPLKVFLKALQLGISRHITIDTSLPENVNIYSLAKKKYADILKSYCDKNKNLSVTNVVLENYYGKDEPKDRFIPSVITKLKNNNDIELTLGDQKRDWIYVDDVIDNLVKFINMDIKGYNDIPLGTGENVSIRKVIEYLKDITGSKSNLLFGAIEKRENEPDTCADKIIMNKYGIEIGYNWEDGFKLLVEEDKSENTY